MTDDTTERAASDAPTSDRVPAGARAPTGGGRSASGGGRSTGGTGRPTRGRGRSTRADRSAPRGGPVGGSEGDTSSAQARFWLTNDVLAVLLVVSLVGVVVGAALGALDLAAVPVELRLAYLTVSGGAAVWTFGQPAYRTWARARRGGRRASGTCACRSGVGVRAVGGCGRGTAACRPAPVARRRRFPRRRGRGGRRRGYGARF
ncbi:hypothetical protein [Halorussus sp. AFM4]|uniref:hypothetical protein n=1 Tax=Halorussus sp. AFM4 TaxID=3421651 RepID=UPI003EB8CA6F